MKTVKSILQVAPFAFLLTAGVATADKYEEVITTGVPKITTYSVRDGVPIATVSLAGLNPNNEQDRVKVDSRLRKAARVVCGSSNHFFEFESGLRSRNRKCALKAVDDGWKQVNAGAVASVNISAHLK